MGAQCTDPQLVKMATENSAELEQIVAVNEAKDHIEAQYPKFRAEASNKFDEHLEAALARLSEHEDIAKYKLGELKKEVGLRCGNDTLKKKYGSSLEGLLSSEEDIGKFKDYHRMLKSEFARKKEVILRALDSQKQLYKSEMAKALPDCEAYEDLSQSSQKSIYGLLKNKLQPRLEQNNSAEYSKFVQKIGLPMFQKNLAELSTIQLSQQHFFSTINKWVKTVESLNL